MHLLSSPITRPVGRPPKTPIVPYHEFEYHAATWSRERRVIAKVEWHHGELFPRIGFIVTNLRRTRLSCRDFIDNQVRSQLFALAYNLGNFFRQTALPRAVRQWTMTALRERVIKIGAKVINHARYTVFQMAEVAVSQELFAAILRRIRKLRLRVEASCQWSESRREKQKWRVS
jgi:hypothetical protein